MSREQIVRDTAYAIWEAEGKPEGRDREHWTQAETHVTASLSDGHGASAKAPRKAKAEPAKVTPPAKGGAEAAKAATAKPPAKAAATKAAPAKR